MEKFQVNVGGIESLQSVVLDHAKVLGFDFSSHASFTDKYNKYYQFNYFGDNQITYSRDLFKPELCPEVSVVDFLSMEKKRIVTLKLNKEYEAVITDEGIAVGCQTFSFNKFDELVEAVKTFRKG